ncbi:MAG: hypothetical protein KBS98_06465, partial [Flavobacterium sp.]|nr:hypothetical protein [Candidatus Neoflavobacterium equi]
IYIITIIVFHIIARIMSKYIKFDLKSDFRFYILSLLFVGLCYLTTPILDNVYDFYKPSVKTEFYR